MLGKLEPISKNNNNNCQHNVKDPVILPCGYNTCIECFNLSKYCEKCKIDHKMEESEIDRNKAKKEIISISKQTTQTVGRKSESKINKVDEIKVNLSDTMFGKASLTSSILVDQLNPCSLIVLKTGVLVYSNKMMLQVWNIDTKTCTNLPEFNPKSSNIMINTKKGKVILGLDDGTIQVLNIETKLIESTLIGHNRPVMCLAELENEKIISGSADKTIRVWDVSSKKCTAVIEAHLRFVLFFYSSSTVKSFFFLI